MGTATSDPLLFLALLLYIASAEAVAAAKAAQQEMYSALLAKRLTLVNEFEKKAARYKEILIKEMVCVCLCACVCVCVCVCVAQYLTCSLVLQQITGIPPEGLTAEEIEKMRKKFGVSFKFSKFVLDDSVAVSVCAGGWGCNIEMQC